MMIKAKAVLTVEITLQVDCDASSLPAGEVMDRVRREFIGGSVSHQAEMVLQKEFTEANDSTFNMEVNVVQQYADAWPTTEGWM